MRLKLLLPALLAAASSACVAYPRPYWTVKSGRVKTEQGKPVVVKAELIKGCETYQGEYERVLKSKETVTDPEGRYKLRIMGLVMNWRNLFSGAECSSRVQMLLCRESREACLEVDDVDIDILEK